MIYFLLAVFHIAFVTFFVSIWTRYVSIVPIGFVVFFVLNNMTELWRYNEIHSLIEHDIYYMSWSVVIVALYLLLHTMWLSPIYNGLFLMVFNIVLYIGSLLYKYKEGITIFHLWRYVAWIIYVAHLSIIFGPLAGWKVFCLLCVFHLAVYGFVQYIVWSFASIPKIHGYLTFLYAQATVLIVLGMLKSENILINLLAWQLYLMWNYGMIYSILRYYHYYQQNHQTDLRYILSGKKIFDIPSVIQNQYLDQVYRFFDQLTPIIKYLFGWLNIAVVIVLIVVFTRHYTSVTAVSTVIYWIWLGIFFGNYTLLKQIRYQSKMERAGIFLILNIWVLLGIGAMFDDIVAQVMFAIVWNLISSMAIFQVRQQYHGLLLPKDYRYRLSANTISVCCVIWRIIMLPINPNVRFSLSLFYCCLYWFLWLQTYKFLKHVDKKSPAV